MPAWRCGGASATSRCWRRWRRCPSWRRLGGYVGSVLGVPGLRAASVLDPAPLAATLQRLISFDAIHRNIGAGSARRRRGGRHAQA